MILLGIETSCDETAAALVEINDKTQHMHLLSSTISSSLALHAKTGGVIPEIAAREQIKYMLPVLSETLSKGLGYTLTNTPPPVDAIASLQSPPKIDAIAVTYGPGLIGSLLVGVETAKTLSFVWNKPLIPVNHLYGHLYANWIEQEKEILFPCLGLVISGGHTDLVLLKNHQDLEFLGGTRDDAAGEAFDKIGRLLGLNYPAGPEIEKRAKLGNAKEIHFPRPMIGEDTYDFSFSGLKAAVFRYVKTVRTMNDRTINDICASVQQAIIDVVVNKTLKAATNLNVKSIILGGGVAANQTLRTSFEQTTKDQRLSTQFFYPDKKLCTDNAAMIAAAGYFLFKEKSSSKNEQVDTSLHNCTANPELYFD